jgi:hypothetical protein
VQAASQGQEEDAHLPIPSPLQIKQGIEVDGILDHHQADSNLSALDIT